MFAKKLAILTLLIIVALTLPRFAPPVRAEEEADENGLTIALDRSLMGEPKAVGGAWLLYAGALMLEIEKDPVETETLNIRFESELAARTQLAKYWKMMKKSKQLANPYLDDLERVYDNGFMPEYIFCYFNQYNWAARTDLRMDAFTDWRKSHLQGHEALTLAWVKRKSAKE